MSARTVLATSSFKASSTQRFSDSELERLIDRIKAEPCDGDEIEDLEGLRLLPWPSRSSGELVWHQVAYLYLEQYELVYLLDVLDYQEQALPTHQDKLDAIEKVGRITELAARIVEILIRTFGSGDPGRPEAHELADRRERENECCAAQRAEQAGSRQARQGAG